jgi:L-amino acid N-acyltransferase YncA
MPFPSAAARIEPMTGAHAAAVLTIYQDGIAEGNATFETCAPDWAAFTAARLPAHRFVAIAEGRVAGWVAASAVSGRCVYAGVVEHSVYVHPAARGRGTGRLLLGALIASTEAAGIWTIQSSRRTPPAWRCTRPPGSAWWGPGNGSASTTAAGATSS